MSILLEKVAQRYAFSHYGNLVLVDEPEFNESENLYVSNLRSDYPLIIQDDRLPEKSQWYVAISKKWWLSHPPFMVFQYYGQDLMEWCTHWMPLPEHITSSKT